MSDADMSSHSQAESRPKADIRASDLEWLVFYIDFSFYIDLQMIWPVVPI